jgi:hypothetical protein
VVCRGAARAAPVKIDPGRSAGTPPQAARGGLSGEHDAGLDRGRWERDHEHVGTFEMLVVLARQPVESQRLLDTLFDPAGQLGIFAGPLGEPGGELAARFAEIAAVVQPTQLLQAVVVDPARHVVERIPEEMHVAA